MCPSSAPDTLVRYAGSARRYASETIYDQDYGYSDLMCEGALFLLAKALRKVFVEGLIGDIREEARWRPQLRLYEHQWKDAASTPLPNTAP